MKQYLSLLFTPTIFLAPYYLEWMHEWHDKFEGYGASQTAIIFISIFVFFGWFMAAVLCAIEPFIKKF